MSIVTRGRIVKREDATNAQPIFRGGPSAAQRTRMAQEEVTSHQNADVILNRALDRARTIVDAARADASHAAARDLDRAIALALLLAQCLVGRAGSLRIGAHPLDGANLRAALAKSGLGGAPGEPESVAVEINDDGALARGSLRVHTDLGTLDARLKPRLERLAAALRDALQPA